MSDARDPPVSRKAGPGAAARAEKPDAPPDVSIVVPFYDEEEAVAGLIDEIAAAFSGWRYEIVAVDDASRDATLARLAETATRQPRLRVVSHGANAGQSRTLRTGILAARAPIIVTLDGDGQNPPSDAPALVKSLIEAGVAMVAGERRQRRDPAAKRWASRLANALRQALLDDGAWDTGCGLKAFRREAYLTLPYFDHMQRYLPALMKREGFGLIFHPVSHRTRGTGRSKYTNLGRLSVALFDLAGVIWLRARSRSPGAVVEQAPDGAEEGDEV